MDWEVLEQDSTKLDDYFKCLYYIEVSESQQQEQIKKITRKLSSASHGTVLPRPMTGRKDTLRNFNKKEKEKDKFGTSMPSLQLNSKLHTKNFTQPQGHRSSTTERDKAGEMTSKSFMALRKELRQAHSLLSLAKEESDIARKERECLSLDLKQETQRAEQLKQLLTANGIAIPEHLQLSKASKPTPKHSKILRRTASSTFVPPKENKPPVDFWSSGDKKVIKYTTTDSGEAIERLSSQMVPQMDIIRPDRALIQEGSCVIVDCEINETPSFSEEIEPELYKIYLFSDAVLLAQVVKKKKIRPEMWLPLAGTRLEASSEELRRRWLLCLDSELQAVRVGVFFADRNLCNNWGESIKTQIKANRPKVFFGVPLESLPTTRSKDGEEIPTLVFELVEYLRKTSLKAEGIFRLAGTKTTAEEIRDILEEGGQLDPSSYDANTLGDIVKQWFRELPVPVIPFDSFRSFIDEFGKGEEEFVEVMRDLLNEIPLRNLGLLRYLVQFLDEISQFSDVNMMTIDNLSTCFGPNLLRPEGEFKSAYEPLACNQCVRVLIENWEKIPSPKSLALPPVLRISSESFESTSPKKASDSPSPKKEKGTDPSPRKKEKGTDPSPKKEKGTDPSPKKEKEKGTEKGTDPSPKKEKEKEKGTDPSPKKEKEKGTTDPSPSSRKGTDPSLPKKEKGTEKGTDPSPKKEKEKGTEKGTDPSPKKEKEKEKGTDPSPKKEKEKEKGTDPSPKKEKEKGTTDPSPSSRKGTDPSPKKEKGTESPSSRKSKSDISSSPKKGSDSPSSRKKKSQQ